MDYLRMEQMARRRKSRHGEDSEPDVIVVVIAAALAVETGPIKKRRAVHEIERNPTFDYLINIHIKATVNRDVKVAIDFSHRSRILIGTIRGRDHGNLVPQVFERGGQGADHIGQAAGFGEGRGLGGHHEDPHWSARS